MKGKRKLPYVISIFYSVVFLIKPLNLSVKGNLWVLLVLILQSDCLNNLKEIL